MSLSGRSLVVLAFGLLALFALAPGRVAQALPPVEVIDVIADAEVVSRLGQETIQFSGAVTIQRQDPRMEDGVEVIDIEILSLTLSGASLTGEVSVTASGGMTSVGELRSLQPPPESFPAASFFDVYADVSMVANPTTTLTLHNNQALHLVPKEDGAEVPLITWPPAGVVYELHPKIYGVDNDGDTAIDEDTADEDGDRLIDEDRSGTDPDTPGGGYECQPDPDCDGAEGEDPPASLCPPPSTTPTLCDPDGDGLIDEDPACIPLLNSGNTHMKAGVCLRHLTVTLGTQPVGGMTELPRAAASRAAGRGAEGHDLPAGAATLAVLVMLATGASAWARRALTRPVVRRS